MVEHSVHGYSPKCCCRPCCHRLLQQRGTPVPCQHATPWADVLLRMRAACCAWSAALCHGPLAQPFLFSWVIRSSRDLLYFPGQKAKRQDKVRPDPPALSASASLGKGCSGTSLFPAIFPGSGAACDVPFSKTDCMEKPGLVFHPGKTLHHSPAAWDGDKQEPIGPNHCAPGSTSSSGSRPVAFCHFQRSRAILHPPPAPGFLPAGAHTPCLPRLRMLVLHGARCQTGQRP